MAERQELEVVELSYSDDTVFPVVSSAETLVSKVSKTIEIVAFVFARLGSQLNFAKGKTESLLEFRGSRAKKARLKFEENSTIPIRMHNNTCVNVHTTNVYRHVGSVFSVGTSVLPDVKAKTYAMTNGIPLHIRRLLRNEGLAIKTKLAVAQSYLFSKGLSSASVWPTLRSLEATTFPLRCSVFSDLLSGISGVQVQCRMSMSWDNLRCPHHLGISTLSVWACCVALSIRRIRYCSPR